MALIRKTGSVRVPRWPNATTLSALLVAGIAWAAAIAFVGGTGFMRAAAACGLACVLGYVTGALLLPPKDEDTTLAIGIVRTVAGLLLSALGFLLCLRLSLPWAIGPMAMLL